MGSKKRKVYECKRHKWYVEDSTEMVRQSRRIEADQKTTKKKKKNKKPWQRRMS